MATTPPPAPPEPLTLNQVKSNLRVDTTDDDDLIGDLIVTAREYLETATGLVLSPRLVTETARELGRWIELSSWPVSEITAIRAPVAGVMTPLAAGSWQASYVRRPVRVLPVTWGWSVGAVFGGCGQRLPMLPVEIDVQAGYATPDLVPMRAKQAMQMLCGHWYANRVGVETGLRAAAIDVPIGVADLCDKLRLRQV